MKRKCINVRTTETSNLKMQNLQRKFSKHLRNDGTRNAKNLNLANKRWKEIINTEKSTVEKFKLNLTIRKLIDREAVKRYNSLFYSKLRFTYAEISGKINQTGRSKFKTILEKL